MKRLIIILSFLFLGSAFAQKSPENLVKYSIDNISINNKNYIALTLENEKGWHTYWKNPGDAGTPTQIEFKNNSKVISLKELDWEMPHRYFETGDLLAYGYEGQYSFFFESDAKFNGQSEAEIKWLVCKDICIPGKANIKFNFNKGLVQNSVGTTLKVGSDKLIQKFKTLPEVKAWPTDLKIMLSGDSKDNKLTLHYEKKIEKMSVSKEHNLLTPYPVKPIGFKRENLFYDTKNGIVHGKIALEWEGEYQEPEMPMPKTNKFSNPLKFKFLYKENGKVYLLEKEFKTFEKDQLIKIPYDKLEKISPTLGNIEEKKNEIIKKEGTKSLIFFIMLAFIGGLILNLMPCILPVISLKLYSLISHQGEGKKRIFKHNLFYTLGVLFCFLLMAAVIVVLKEQGHQLGWGFQLQSLTFLKVMIYLLFILALNMFGLFEFGTPGGKTLGNKNLNNDLLGDFLGGIFATILSTPCSAPFLGTALTFAFTTNSINIFLIFISIGLGLSFPFILTGFYPKLIDFLPRPGLWMETLKKFLGFTLILTILWLYDVMLKNNPPITILNQINLTLALIFFSIYLYKIIKKQTWVKILFGLMTVTTIVISLNTTYQLKTSEKVSYSDHWVPFSKEALDQYPNQVVFLDFTAEWCFTCKVNEKILLDTDRFKTFAKENNIVLMKGDWTKRDDAITNFLKSYNIFGVPAYFVKKKNGDMVFLGELITIEKIKSEL